MTESEFLQHFLAMSEEQLQESKDIIEYIISLRGA